MLRSFILSIAATTALAATPPDGALYLAEVGAEASHEVKDGHLIMRIPVEATNVSDVVFRQDTKDASLFWLELHMDEWRDPGDRVYHFEPSSEEFGSFSVGGSKIHRDGCSWQMKFTSKENALKAFQAVTKAYQLDEAHALNETDKGDWLPVPDGYVWPLPAENAPDFNRSRKKLDELSEDYQNAIKAHWPDEELPEQVEIAEADLNEDRVPELFLAIPAYSGTGGTYFEILTSAEGVAYKSVGHVGGWGVQFLKQKNGWFQIESMSRAGSGDITRCLETFGSEAYETTRNESHNYHTGKVTVRDFNAE
ncbi:MAG: hypothetical protein GWQ05_20865 [Verrucomicrobiaceae bacterium]|nr:hypothetical protein [Verrucomicrobiaceae bacterium]